MRRVHGEGDESAGGQDHRVDDGLPGQPHSALDPEPRRMGESNKYTKTHKHAQRSELCKHFQYDACAAPCISWIS